MAAIDLLFTFLIAVSNSELLPWAELFLIVAAFALVLFVVVVGGLCLGLNRGLWALCGLMCWARLDVFFLVVNAWVLRW